jgi:hypothetical protein
MGTNDIIILILAGLYLAFYVAKLGYKVYRFALIKIKYRKTLRKGAGIWTKKRKEKVSA